MPAWTKRTVTIISGITLSTTFAALFSEIGVSILLSNVSRSGLFQDNAGHMIAGRRK